MITAIEAFKRSTLYSSAEDRRKAIHGTIQVAAEGGKFQTMFSRADYMPGDFLLLEVQGYQIMTTPTHIVVEWSNPSIK